MLLAKKRLLRPFGGSAGRVRRVAIRQSETANLTGLFTIYFSDLILTKLLPLYFILEHISMQLVLLAVY
jgi:hypothetical protein